MEVRHEFDLESRLNFTSFRRLFAEQPASSLSHVLKISCLSEGQKEQVGAEANFI